MQQRGALWWQGGADIDYDIERRFGKLVSAAARGSFTDWLQLPQSAVALIILNDQFPRNIHRGSAKAFAQDALARNYAKKILDSDYWGRLHPLEKTFVLMPFEHSENLADQDFCVAQFEALTHSAEPEWTKQMGGFLTYAREHHEIIAEFSRFPHRNAALGRTPTQAEEQYLASRGKRFGQ